MAIEDAGYEKQAVAYGGTPDLGAQQRPQAMPGHDEQVVPAHMQGKLIDFATADDTTFDMNQGRKVFRPDELLTTEGAEGDEEDPATLKVQNLPQSQRAYAEQLVPFYGGEMVPCMMYSPKWKMREQGVQSFIAGMQDAMAQAVQETASQQPPEALTPENKCN